MSYLLDTHILIWWLFGSRRLSAGQRQVLDAVRPDAPLLVAGITLWEVSTLAELGRIDLGMATREWLERAVAPPLVRVLPLTPAIAAEVGQLGKDLHRDPADRILVATARIHGATLVTSDRKIQRAGLVPTLG